MPTMSRDVRCLSCEIVQGGWQLTGGPILETAHYHAHQDVSYPVPGQVIVATKRHVRNLDELSVGEIGELLPILVKIRAAQRAILGFETVYYFYNEDTTHHFHVWMVPRDETVWTIDPSCSPGTLTCSGGDDEPSAYR
jgi:diadenosine tetraphosphate (Ap4A) HIT family hydrolase